MYNILTRSIQELAVYKHTIPHMFDEVKQSPLINLMIIII